MRSKYSNQYGYNKNNWYQDDNIKHNFSGLLFCIKNYDDVKFLPTLADDYPVLDTEICSLTYQKKGVTFATLEWQIVAIVFGRKGKSTDPDTMIKPKYTGKWSNVRKRKEAANLKLASTGWFMDPNWAAKKSI